MTFDGTDDAGGAGSGAVAARLDGVDSASPPTAGGDGLGCHAGKQTLHAAAEAAG